MLYQMRGRESSMGKLHKINVTAQKKLSYQATYFHKYEDLSTEPLLIHTCDLVY